MIRLNWIDDARLLFKLGYADGLDHVSWNIVDIAYRLNGSIDGQIDGRA